MEKEFSVSYELGDNQKNIAYGDKFYIVDSNEYKHFSGICPVCAGEKTINVKGFTFDCPYCCTSYSANFSNHISVRSFEVQEYIINSINIKGNNVKKDFQESTFRLPKISASAFHNCKNKYNLQHTRTLSIDDTDLRLWNINIEELSLEDRQKMMKRPSSYYFDNKMDAEKFCAILIENEKKQLEKFNIEHGTEHEFPF